MIARGGCLLHALLMKMTTKGRNFQIDGIRHRAWERIVNMTLRACNEMLPNEGAASAWFWPLGGSGMPTKISGVVIEYKNGGSAPDVKVRVFDGAKIIVLNMTGSADKNRFALVFADQQKH